MEDLSIVVDLVIAVVAAFLGGMIAHRLRQPVILGYLVAGVVIGPYTPGPVGNTHNVQLMAELGVAFLMFALGTEFTPEEFFPLGWVAGLGGMIQIFATVLLGVAVSPLLGLNSVQGIFLGSILALSSTMVALKVLMARGELESLHGRIVLGILILQDLSLVPMMVILPALAGPMDSLFATLALSGLKAAAILAGGWFLGTRIAPILLSRVASTGSRELFLLAITTLALGTAVGTYALGLSIAVGAFLAGLVIAESEYSHQALAEVIPMRDIFASIFFVSVGMLIDPAFLLSNIGGVSLILAVVIAGKLVVAGAVPIIFGYSGRIAILVGLSLAQIGEFSFVLTRLGQTTGVIDQRVASLILSAALLSLLINPLLLHLGGGLIRLLEKLPLVGRLFGDAPTPVAGSSKGLRDHVVISGFGRVGSEVVTALLARGEPMVVIELDPHVVSELRRMSIPSIYGDSSALPVLSAARVDHARLVVVTLPDLPSAIQAVRNIRKLNPAVTVLARAHHPDELDEIRAAGADEVIFPEFEAGLEFLRHTMSHLGVADDEITELMLLRRATRQPPIVLA